MAHLDGLPDVLVLEEPSPRLDLHRAGEIRRAQRAWDALAGVHRDEVADAIVRALRAGQYAEKLAAPEQVVPEPGAKSHLARVLAEAEALCTPDAGRFAA
jgi:predicted metal-dependent hydrolase